MRSNNGETNSGESETEAGWRMMSRHCEASTHLSSKVAVWVCDAIHVLQCGEHKFNLKMFDLKKAK